MKIKIMVEENVESETICVGCSKLFLLEKGYNWRGGCDCPSDDRCDCEPMSKSRDYKKDVWQCSLYKKDLGKIDKPKRANRCIDISNGDISKLTQQKKEIDILKVQVTKLKKALNKTATKYAILNKFRDSIIEANDKLKNSLNWRVYAK